MSCTVSHVCEARSSVLLSKAKVGVVHSGRYVCGDAGTYYTKIIDKKTSHGKTYLILSNTLNGFFHPSVALMVEGNSDGIPKPYEPMYIKPDASPISVLNGSTVKETVTLAGNLCTSADLVKKDITLNKCDVGDILSFGNAGCYSYVLTPVQVASQTPPSQIFVHEDGTLTER